MGVVEPQGPGGAVDVLEMDADLFGHYLTQVHRADLELTKADPHTPWVIWTRSANSHTGQRRFAAAQQAGQMAAPDYPSPSQFNLR
jgi:hypothetical protein